jgi:hypothetical protein
MATDHIIQQLTSSGFQNSTAVKPAATMIPETHCRIPSLASKS